MEISDVRLPAILYGTAWKEDRTRELVALAVQQGFHGFDTANQRRHYVEADVGEAISAAIAEGTLTREQLFLQTKFTFRGGQDHRLPYDPKAPVERQVEQSFQSSLEHLKVEQLDSYVLHGPTTSDGLTRDDWSAWRAIEALHAAGKTKLIGVSNVTYKQLQVLCNNCQTPPHFVQNRCYAVLRWNEQVRTFCNSRGIIYQGFSLLTANREALMSKAVTGIAAKYRKTVPQIIFRFAIDVGMLPLTGTTNPIHMKQDLSIFDFRLEAEEVAAIERAGVR